MLIVLLSYCDAIKQSNINNIFFFLLHFDCRTFMKTPQNTCPDLHSNGEAAVSRLQIDSQVLLAYCSYEEAQFLFRLAAEVGLLGPGYIWILPSLAVGNPNSAPPDSFPVGVIGVITEQWRKSLRQRVREGVAIVAKGAESFKKQHGFVPEGHGDCSKPAKHADNNTMFR